MASAVSIECAVEVEELAFPLVAVHFYIYMSGEWKWYSVDIIDTMEIGKN